MSFAKIVLGLVVVALVGGFAYLALSDVHVPQTRVTKTIANDRFLNQQ